MSFAVQQINLFRDCQKVDKIEIEILQLKNNIFSKSLGFKVIDISTFLINMATE